MGILTNYHIELCYGHLHYNHSMSILLIVRHDYEADMQNGGPSRGERLQIMLNADELQVLDDFRFRKRMPSRAAAIRELLKRGLNAEGFEAAAFGAKSEDFGVMGRTPKGRDVR